MKITKTLAIVLALLVVLTACGKIADNGDDYDGIEIVLSDEEITVEGEAVSEDHSEAVYIDNDIIYYESGKDFSYGEGTEKDAHTKEEAEAHTVVHITKAGNYVISGKLSKGQIAVDLGDDVEENPEAVVTLVLNDMDITCEVAPAVIFYNVYECGDTDADKAIKDVDTSKAGANVIIADGTVNTVNGSNVEKIYKPESVVLNEDKTEVEDAKKLHKYDGAFYSKMSMNIFGGKDGSGILNINAENEGLDSELHLTINGGNINIRSGNDGINTNEDGVSVTTVNGGTLTITVTGETGEGDGIDSNGWLVINGGKVVSSACSFSADAGIDSDMGIHINGGIVIATGNMLDRIEEGGQNYAVFNFADKQKDTDALTFKNADDEALFEYKAENDYSILIYSNPELKEGTYTLWDGENQLAGYSSDMMNMMSGGFKPGVELPKGMTPPDFSNGGEMPDRPEMPQNGEFPDGQKPQRGEMPPEGFEVPEGFEFPNGEQPPAWNGVNMPFEGFSELSGELKKEFEIKAVGNMFSGITEYTE